jgi:glycosyltransferase involved in cell wall biosynthesis
MKILHVVPWLTLRAGGTSVVVVGLARALQALGVDVSIYTTDMAVPAQSDRLSRGVVLGDFPAGSGDIDIEIFPVNHPYRLVFSPQMHRALNASVEDFDVVHIHSLFLYPQFAAWFTASRNGIPYVVSPHGALDPFLRKKGRLRKRLVDVIWQRRMLDGADAFHLTTDEERALVADLGIVSSQCVIPIGIETGAFQNLPSDERFRSQMLDGVTGPVILHHGRISEKKGLDILVESFESIVSVHPSARLVLVGPDDEGLADRLRLQANGLGIGHAVRFTGPLSGEALREALAAADVWALPSHTENFGLALVEAMAAGRPVVTSPHVNIAAAAEQGGAAIVVDNTPEEVAVAILHLLANPNRRNELSRNAVEFARRYDWHAVGKQFIDLYSSLSK